VDVRVLLELRPDPGARDQERALALLERVDGGLVGLAVDVLREVALLHPLGDLSAACRFSGVS
jgi:hypothetical protein